jgi:hypothetical protein
MYVVHGEQGAEVDATGRILIALDADVGLSPSELVAAWDGDAEASALGIAELDASPRDTFFPDIVALVVIPLIVNLASSAVYDHIRRVVSKARRSEPENHSLELIELTSSDGDRILIVRMHTPDL